jgi:hypothetical protein
MASIRAMRGTAYADDHFEPEAALDPHAQRRIRGALEQIDYMAFACNRDVFAQLIANPTMEGFQKLAMATAKARGRWVSYALELANAGTTGPEKARELKLLRETYEELAECYEALRRLTERGYISVPAETPAVA